MQTYDITCKVPPEEDNDIDKGREKPYESFIVESESQSTFILPAGRRLTLFFYIMVITHKNLRNNKLWL